jgi:hypothetical protein
VNTDDAIKAILNSEHGQLRLAGALTNPIRHKLKNKQRIYVTKGAEEINISSQCDIELPKKNEYKYFNTVSKYIVSDIKRQEQIKINSRKPDYVIVKQDVEVILKINQAGVGLMVAFETIILGYKGDK